VNTPRNYKHHAPAPKPSVHDAPCIM